MIVLVGLLLVVPQDDAARAAHNAWDAALADSAAVVAAVGRDGSLRILDARNGRELDHAPELIAGLWNIDISPDGNTVAALARDRTVHLWKWRVEEAPRQVAKLAGDPSSWDAYRFGSAVSFSPDGSRLFVGYDTSERLLLGTDGELIARIPLTRIPAPDETEGGSRDAPSGRFVVPFAWSADSARLALVTDGSPVIHDARTGARESLELEAFGSMAACVALDPTGRHLAAADSRGQVTLWELESRKQVWSRRHVEPPLDQPRVFWRTDGIGDIEFSPDGKSLALTTVVSVCSLLLDVESGERTWTGAYHGGRMGEPTQIVWTPDGHGFYHAYVSGHMPLYRVALGAKRLFRRDTESEQYEYARSTLPDIGWRGLGVVVTADHVRAISAASGRLVWEVDG
jgi:WD40 repeat protein